MKGEAVAEPLLGRGPRARGRVVELGERPHHADHVRPERGGVLHRLRLEEPAPQHRRHLLLAHRLNPLLTLPPEHVEQPGDQFAPQVAALLAGVGGQQRSDDRRPVDLGHGLRQVLEEVGDAIAPHGVGAGLLAGVHQHFVDQDQRGQPALLRPLDQLHQERFGRRRLALLVAAVGVHRAQPVRAGELVRQHAPRVAQRAGRAVRGAHPVDAPLHVDLVEAERHRKRGRQGGADVLPELPHRRQVRQPRRIAEQVVERDQGVGLAAAVGQFELPHRLVALPREPAGDVLHQLPQRVGRIGEGEEPRRVFVDGALPARQRHLVQVGGELGQRQLPRPQFFLQPHDFMPGLGARVPVHFRPSRGNHARRVACNSLKAESLQPSKSTVSASSRNLRADSGVRLCLIARSIASFGSCGFGRPAGHIFSEANQRRNSRYRLPHPNTCETSGESAQTHTSSSGSMTMTLERSSQPFRIRFWPMSC